MIPHSSPSVVDIELPTNSMNAVEITLSGRYPETGFVLNKESEMVVRVLKGSVRFWCEDDEVLLKEGATVLVQTNKKYCWIPEGSVTLYIVSTPPWTAEQQVSVPGK